MSDDIEEYEDIEQQDWDDSLELPSVATDAEQMSQPPPGWQWSTWQGKLEPGRVRLSGTMNTRTLKEAWTDYKANPCPYENVVPRVEPKKKEEKLSPNWKWDGDALILENQKPGFSLLADVIEYPQRGYILCYGNRTRMKIDLNAMKAMINRYDEENKK